MLSERIYRLLLRAYARTHRERYAGPMEQLFRDRLRAATGFRARAALWAHTLADWAMSVPSSYRRSAELQPWQVCFGAGARRSIFFARFEASSVSRPEITLEHLLLGLLRQDRSLLSAEGRDVARRRIEAAEANPRRRPAREDLRLSWDCRKAIDVARETARSNGRRRISSADLAAGILAQEESLAARLLRDLR